MVIIPYILDILLSKIIKKIENVNSLNTPLNQTIIVLNN